MQVTGLERAPQGFARADDMLLTDELIQVSRPHAIRQRSVCQFISAVTQQIALARP